MTRVKNKKRKNAHENEPKTTTFKGTPHKKKYIPKLQNQKTKTKNKH